jgi:hypothetical protein
MLIYVLSPAQDFTVMLQPVNISGLPGLQSYAYGQHDGKWLVIGGRTDGLHLRQPPFTFLAADNNTDIYVIDPEAGQYWSAPLASLTTSMQEQLQSTNMQFHQWGNVLYISGGYGYSATANNHITHPYLTAVDVPGTVNAIINNQPVSSYFRQLTDTNMSVTGGHLSMIGDTFYLVCGQKFTGRYNPMGPNHGPGFVQDYTNQVRKFTINDNGTTLSINNYNIITDAVNLHRRDYNLVNQVFPDGRQGFTVFTGVFQYNIDRPYLNTVDIDAAGHYVNNNFSQYLSQYHSAVMPMYDSAANEMHSVFFGGMSQFYYDANNVLVEDTNVPFVKTISRVTRHANGTMDEVRLNVDMPDYLGSGAEFIPLEGIAKYENEVIKLNYTNGDTVLAGYIYGGIKSTAPNIFWVNDGTQSIASPVIYKVYIVKSAATGLNKVVGKSPNPLNMSVYPNPANEKAGILFTLNSDADVYIYLQDTNGAMVNQYSLTGLKPGNYDADINLANLPQATYFITVSTDRFMQTKPVIKK